MGTKPARKSGVLDNPKHEAFAQAIAIEGLKPREAWASVGYKPHNGNPYRLRDSERVSNRIAELRGSIFRRIERKMEATVDRLTEEFAAIGFADATDVIAVQDGQTIVRNTADLPPHVRAAIAEIRQTKDGVVIKMHNKTDALANLAKHIGYYKENVQLNVTLTLAELVNMSYRDDLPALPEPKVIDHEDESQK